MQARCVMLPPSTHDTNISSPVVNYTPLITSSSSSSSSSPHIRWYTHQILLDVVSYHEQHQTLFQSMSSFVQTLSTQIQSVVKWLIRYPEQQVHKYITDILSYVHTTLTESHFLQKLTTPL